MASHALSPVVFILKGLYFGSLPGLGICNMSFLIADVMQFVSGTMMTSSLGVQQNSNVSSFQSLAPRL